MSAAIPTLVPVILCGGTGTRLWPLSREGYPKQFWPLAGEGTMLQETAARARGPGFAEPIVVASEAHRFLVAEQLREGGTVAPRIVLEPEARNSAPAIAVAGPMTVTVAVAVTIPSRIPRWISRVRMMKPLTKVEKRPVAVI